ncbi:MAG: DUF2007 domain-containing protein [Candidatus Omnitrophica bacterium]|nr:DUF2007 domain-containing protein [Candidatus Omnitrophota bacterium]
MQDLVPIEIFLSRHEAEVVRGFLLDRGVESVISIDDVGGQLPGLNTLSGGIRLLVRRGDLKRAKEILENLD